MKRAMFSVALVVGWATAGLSQVGVPTAAGETRVLEGCLAYTGATYVLAVVDHSPKQYRVIGGEIAPLKRMVGHTVRITGPTGNSTWEASVISNGLVDATTGVTFSTVSAEKVRDITSNCSYPGFDEPAKP